MSSYQREEMHGYLSHVWDINLINLCEAKPRHTPYSIHKVTIAPFEQEMCQDASVLGMLFDFCVITGMMSPAGFGFATWGEGKGDGYGKWYNISRVVLIFFKIASAPSSPVKFKSKSSVLKSVSVLLPSLNFDFSASCSFNIQVS